MELLVLLRFGTFLFEEKTICGVTFGQEWMEWFPLLEYWKAVPGSVQHNTAVDSVTKVPIISGKELKSMKNDLQFRSCTRFRRLTDLEMENKLEFIQSEISKIEIICEECAQEISSWFICFTQLCF